LHSWTEIWESFLHLSSVNLGRPAGVRDPKPGRDPSTHSCVYLFLQLEQRKLKTGLEPSRRRSQAICGASGLHLALPQVKACWTQNTDFGVCPRRLGFRGWQQIVLTPSYWRVLCLQQLKGKTEIVSKSGLWAWEGTFETALKGWLCFRSPELL
jgi:hypothetical protein